MNAWQAQSIPRELTNLTAMTKTIKAVICEIVEYKMKIASPQVIDKRTLKKPGKNNTNKEGIAIPTIR